MIEKYPEKPYKYPIDIELSSRCGLNCIWCIHHTIKNQWDLTLENFRKILQFIQYNKNDIVYISFAWIGESLLNKDILLILDELKELPDIFLLIPTKGWRWLTDDIIIKIQELRDYWININLQLWLYSLREKIVNHMYWWTYWSVNHYADLIDSIKRMKSLKFDFCLELLLTKYSKEEVPSFKKFCDTLWVEWVVHRLHNFWWKLENYESLYIAWETDPYHDYNGMCGFKPFFTWNWEVTAGTFCSHYNFWNVDKYTYSWGMIDILNQCYDTIRLDNEYCKKCDDNILNVRWNRIEKT